MNQDGSTYTVATPYVGSDLSTLRFVQSADVMTIVHPNYAPMELSRTGPLAWDAYRHADRHAARHAGHADEPVGAEHGPGVQQLEPVPGRHRVVLAHHRVQHDHLRRSQLSPFVATSNLDTTYFAQFGTMNTLSWAAVPGPISTRSTGCGRACGPSSARP